MTAGTLIARGLLGAADVGDGPTREQRNLIESLLHGYFGSPVDVASLEPLAAADFAAGVDEPDRSRVADLLVLVEFCRHTTPPLRRPRGGVRRRARVRQSVRRRRPWRRWRCTRAASSTSSTSPLAWPRSTGPGATAVIADAFHRGAACVCDFSEIDHLARSAEPLDAVRAECGITPRTA